MFNSTFKPAWKQKSKKAHRQNIPKTSSLIDRDKEDCAVLLSNFFCYYVLTPRSYVYLGLGQKNIKSQRWRLSWKRKKIRSSFFDSHFHIWLLAIAKRSFNYHFERKKNGKKFLWLISCYFLAFERLAASVDTNICGEFWDRKNVLSMDVQTRNVFESWKWGWIVDWIVSHESSSGQC